MVSVTPYMKKTYERPIFFLTTCTRPTSAPHPEPAYLPRRGARGPRTRGGRSRPRRRVTVASRSRWRSRTARTELADSLSEGLSQQQCVCACGAARWRVCLGSGGNSTSPAMPAAAAAERTSADVVLSTIGRDSVGLDETAVRHCLCLALPPPSWRRHCRCLSALRPPARSRRKTTRQR